MSKILMLGIMPDLSVTEYPEWSNGYAQDLAIFKDTKLKTTNKVLYGIFFHISSLGPAGRLT